MVHSTADESFAATARIGDQAVEAALAALAAGAPVVCDSRMVVAGIPSVAGAVCFLDQVAEAPPGDTRSAAAVRLAAERHPDGALWVVGNAPTALFALLNLYASGALRPAAVVGLPVGYVGAAESKAALWAGNLRPLAITNTGRAGRQPRRRRRGQRPGPPGRRPIQVGSLSVTPAKVLFYCTNIGWWTRGASRFVRSAATGLGGPGKWPARCSRDGRSSRSR